LKSAHSILLKTFFVSAKEEKQKKKNIKETLEGSDGKKTERFVG